MEPNGNGSTGIAMVTRPSQEAERGTSYDRRIRAAISLNNMAISMLADRHCHRQAHLLWMDAVSILHITDSRGRNEVGDDDSDDATVVQRVARAVHRAEELSRQTGVVKRRLHVQVLSDDLSTSIEAVNRSLMQCYKDPVHRCGGGAASFLVRIESLDFDDPKQGDRVSATIFYNYATSILLQSDAYAYACSSSARRTKLRARGALILNVAMGLAASSVPNPDQRVDAERWWLLRLLIEASSTRVLAQLGQADASRRRYESFQRTSRLLGAYQHVLNMMRAGRQVAAAA